MISFEVDPCASRRLLIALTTLADIFGARFPISVLVPQSTCGSADSKVSRNFSRRPRTTRIIRVLPGDARNSISFANAHLIFTRNFETVHDRVLGYRTYHERIFKDLAKIIAIRDDREILLTSRTTSMKIDCLFIAVSAFGFCRSLRLDPARTMCSRIRGELFDFNCSSRGKVIVSHNSRRETLRIFMLRRIK